MNVTIRMYNPGFGDCFLISVDDDGRRWRMLVDCGVHSHGRAKVNGQSRNIGEIVNAVIAHLREESEDGQPRLDVVVATHRHADHISGFANDAWTEVDVKEVWLPFVEDRADPDTQKLRNGLAAAAETVRAVTERASNGGPFSSWRPAMALAFDFAANFAVSHNAIATERLTGGDFKPSSGDVTVRYLPSREEARNTIETGIAGAVVEVLGPSRDPAYLKRMNPPAAVRWLAEAALEGDREGDQREIFDPLDHVPNEDINARMGSDVLATRDSIRLTSLAIDEDAILAAASILERSVNNTSLFFVLDVRGDRFVFVGDSQQGAWEHVLDNARSRELVSSPRFYKVGHHGSHNATPASFVHDVLGDDVLAMIPVGRVKAWEDKIPYKTMVDSLLAKNTRVVRADDPPQPDDTITVGPEGLWIEATFPIRPESTPDRERASERSVNH